jgi:hypothetical protein
MTDPCAARAAIAIAVAYLVLPHATPALASSCATQAGWRYVEVEQLKPERLTEIGKVKFAKDAKLMLGDASEGIKGVDDPEENYTLAVTRAKDRIVFAFVDEKTRKGTLTLTIPKSISIFEVDPRGRTEAQEKALDGRATTIPRPNSSASMQPCSRSIQRTTSAIRRTPASWRAR